MSRERQRALKTQAHVKLVPKDEHKPYASLAYQLPVLLRTAGLAQTVAFLASRSNERGKRLTLQLGECLGIERNDAGRVFSSIAEAKTGAYIALSAEAVACADWYVRHVQAILKVERTDTEDE